MSTTMEQLITQLQQELFALRAQVITRSGLAEAVQAIKILATAHVRKDTWTSEGILWQGRGFPTVVEEY